MPHSLPLPCLLLSRLFFSPLHQVGDMVTGLRGLKSRLLEMREYLEAVATGRLPVNHDIMRNMQVCVCGVWWWLGVGGRLLLLISCATQAFCVASHEVKECFCQNIWQP
jgi:hypothetical protein